MKKFLKTFLLFSLISAICIGIMRIPSKAVQKSEEGRQVVFSQTAGMNGYYQFDEESGKDVYVPNDMPVIQDGLDLKDDDLIKSFIEMTSSNSLNTYQEILAPSGVQLSTCLLGARFDSGDEDVKKGTGWLLNNTYVVTAGHVIYDEKYKNNGKDGYAQHVAVYVGASNGNKRQYRLGHPYWIGGDFKNNPSNPAYTNKGRFDDWGVIKLDSPVTVSVSKLKLHTVNSASEMKNQTYTVTGYPEDLQPPVDSWTKWNMFKTSGTIFGDVPMASTASPNVIGLVGASGMRLYHGMSGGPLSTTRSGISGTLVEGIAVGECDGISCYILMNTWLTNKLQSLM